MPTAPIQQNLQQHTLAQRGWSYISSPWQPRYCCKAGEPRCLDALSFLCAWGAAECSQALQGIGHSAAQLGWGACHCSLHKQRVSNGHRAALYISGLHKAAGEAAQYQQSCRGWYILGPCTAFSSHSTACMACAPQVIVITLNSILGCSDASGAIQHATTKRV